MEKLLFKLKSIEEGVLPNFFFHAWSNVKAYSLSILTGIILLAFVISCNNDDNFISKTARNSSKEMADDNISYEDEGFSCIKH